MEPRGEVRRLSVLAAALRQNAAAAETETTTAVSMDELTEEYERQNPTSKQWFDRAQASLPGGNTRTGSYYKPFPIYWESGEGPYAFDVDGNKRLDFVNQATCLTLGHSFPAVADAIRERSGKGTAFFGPSRYEVELAELLTDRIASMDHIRFCSSGTEAVLNAHRVARAFTGRPNIAKFEGAYHGIDDPALISYLPKGWGELGPEDQPASVAVSPGLAPGTAESTLILPFNDAVNTRRIITEHASELAAVRPTALCYLWSAARQPELTPSPSLPGDYRPAVDGGRNLPAEAGVPQSAARSDGGARHPADLRRDRRLPHLPRRRPGAHPLGAAPSRPASPERFLALCFRACRRCLASRRT